jgi:hypothetical protein
VNRGRRGIGGKIPHEQCAIVAVNIRALRQRKGWSQAKLGELMGWQSTSTVWQLTTRCANCHGHPPAGFACLACGAIPGGDHSDAPALTHQVRHGHTAVRG